MFGFGKGKIQLQLMKYQFAPGEEVQGTMIMTLKKPIQAKGVKVRLLARETVSQGRSSRTITLFDFTQPLDGEKEYLPGQPLSYNFKIKIPVGVGQNIVGGTLGTALKTANMFMGRRSRIKWTLKASLDIPKGIDVSKTVRINVG